MGSCFLALDLSRWTLPGQASPPEAYPPSLQVRRSGSGAHCHECLYRAPANWSQRQQIGNHSADKEKLTRRSTQHIYRPGPRKAVSGGLPGGGEPWAP